MPFIPHTERDEQEMLTLLGAGSIEELFDEIPPALRGGDLSALGPGIGEAQLLRGMSARAAGDGAELNFIGAGAYAHHIPAAVWDLASRGEYLTAYTPYQAEASQGTLQLIYEFQTMITALMGMDVANASVYDGASALAEAVLMAVRANRKSRARRVAIPNTVHPSYRSAVRNIVASQGIELVGVATGPSGTTELRDLPEGELTALVIPQPAFFGTLEDVHALTDAAHARGALVIAVVNPIALGMLTPPGQWGETGADIAVGEGQPLGIPLAGGGPYLGLMCCRQSIVRQMPGRIVGRTVDLDNRTGFALTLQAREQHIRRAKATSNICTNQGLLVTAATIYMALLGPTGIKGVAQACHTGLMQLLACLEAVAGASVRFNGPHFHEAVIDLTVSADAVLGRMATQGIAGGLALGRFDPGLERSLLVNVTEVHSAEDRSRWAEALAHAVVEISDG